MILTRAMRPRLFSTQYGHAALSRAIEVTCAYQSDSSSKRPVASAVLDSMCHLQPGAPRPQFSTCWRKSGATKIARRPAAAYSKGAAPHHPSLGASACGELLPAPPRHSLGPSAASLGKRQCIQLTQDRRSPDRTGLRSHFHNDSEDFP
jgi:hypothetical protein